jgi:mycothiol synthase
LFLLWPRARLANPPAIQLPHGYELRTFEDGDDGAWLAIQELADPVIPGGDFGGFLLKYHAALLPGGLFFAFDRSSGQAVATAGAIHNTRDGMFPGGGELAWVATVPAHQSKGLGRALSAAAVRRMLDAGYESIRVGTQDHRLPAIKVYLRMGFLPYLYACNMADRWSRICTALNWPFAPEEWIIRES